MTSKEVDQRFYQVARPGTLAEWMTAKARDGIYADFLRLAAPSEASMILDVGVSDVVGEAANVLERKYPHLERVTAVGLGAAVAFQAQFPDVRYRQIEPDESLPFADKSFDVATSNAVLEHVGSEAAQQQFVNELVRVAKCTFISVPHRFFPVEHHTGIPFLHWSDMLFERACRLAGKQEWSDEANLIMMTRDRLRRLSRDLPSRIGMTGLRLGPFSSNLYLLVGPPA